MSDQRFYVIGITDEQECFFTPEISRIISEGKVFSGGKRHYEIVKDFLPYDSEWINITVPLDKVFNAYNNHPEIVVFASGDPLFFGFATTIQKRIPNAEIKVFPAFNSLQMLAHRMVIPYQDMHTVSLTGRPWDEFDKALIEGRKKIGSLTDRHKTPACIAARMLEFGYDNYQITVGELLGNEELEQVRTYTLKDASEMEFAFPNCIILQQITSRNRPFGIPESEFHLLNGRVNMITKMPYRLLSLSMLDLYNKTSFWDIGFCTGSVSIEAKLQFPHLKIHSFEQREEGRELMELNARKFGTPGIETHIGDFLETDITEIPQPDAVFIGGHGGKMIEILQKVNEVLLPGGIIVFNAVSENSIRLFQEGIEQIHRTITKQIHLEVDSFNPIEIFKAE